MARTILIAGNWKMNGLSADGTALASGVAEKFKTGAHTGDTSAWMLKDAGCSYAIVGHSERRTDHAESNDTVKAKAQAALDAGLKVIICIGETLDERKAGKTMDINKSQLLGSLPEVSNADNTVIAYEPVWAIGTGEVATPEQAQEVHAMLRAELVAAKGQAVADGMRILYGGSMNPKNAKELLALQDVDGGLIGGAALKVDDFWAVAQSAP